MTNKSISQLTAGAAVSSTDIFPDVQTNGVGPVKVTAAQIGDYVLGGSGLTSVLPVSRGGTGTGTAFTAGSVVFAGASGTYSQDNSQFFWDNTNNRLGIGNPSPLTQLMIDGVPDSTYGNFALRDTTAFATGVGGQLVFAGKYNTAGAFANFARIAGVKENSTDGNYQGALVFSTQAGAFPYMQERARIDSSGNLGLGVTPSAWDTTSGQRAFQLKDYVTLWQGGNGSANLAFNTYEYAGNAYKYLGATYASKYTQLAGEHRFFTAASGTAGGTITFTQAMTLTADGNLGLGTPSPSNFGAGYKTLDVAGTSGAGIVQVNSTSVISRWQADESGALLFKTVTNHPIQFYTNDQPVVRIDSSGNLLVGTTTSSARLYVKGSGATGSTNSFLLENSSGTQLIQARDDGLLLLPSTYSQTTASAANIYIDSSGFIYRSTSSQRYKSNIQNAVHGLSDLQKLRSVTYNGINDGNKIFGGLIAEEVDAAGLTEFVVYDSEGQPDALHYGNMAGLFVKAIQELAAKVAELEAKV